jgi:hypothetical protein
MGIVHVWRDMLHVLCSDPSLSRNQAEQYRRRQVTTRKVLGTNRKTFMEILPVFCSLINIFILLLPSLYVKVQVLHLLKLQFPPGFNMCLEVSKRVTTLILWN